MTEIEVGVTSFEDEQRGHKPRNSRCLYKLEKVREPSI